MTHHTSGAADLRTAAQAVVDRWDTPLWKDTPSTAEYIGRLRTALASAPAQPVAEPLKVFSKGPWTFRETGQDFSGADLDEAAFVAYRERASRGQALSAAQAELAAMRAGGEPVAEMVPCHTPSGKRVAIISRFQHLPIGTKLYTHPQPDTQDAERWMELGQAIEQACMTLPEGVEVAMSFEQDAWKVKWFDENGNEHDTESHESGVASVMNDAIDTAIAAQGENKNMSERAFHTTGYITPAQPRTNDVARAIVEAADMNDRVLVAIDAEFAAPAQQPWKDTPPAQERIDALELEVRQLTEQIAELRHAPRPKQTASQLQWPTTCAHCSEKHSHGA